MGNEELKAKIVEFFHQKSKSGKKKFYMKDVVKAMKEEGYEKKEIQHAVNDCTVDKTIMYWSSGSTTMLCLAEDFHE